MNQSQIYNLVEAAKRGDDDAFAELYEAAYPMVYHVSLGYLKNNEDAEDLTQEVFLKAYNSLNTLSDNLAFFGWVQTMAANRSKNKLRDRKEYVSYEDTDIEQELSGDDNLEFLPDNYIMQEDQRKVLINIMRKELSDVQYQTIYIYYYNNLTVEQIASVMGVPAGTVKTRLKNSRIKIKEGVERYERVTNDKISVCGAIPAIGLVISQSIKATPMSFVPFAKFAIVGTAAGAAAGAAGTTGLFGSTSILSKVIIGVVAVGTIGAGTVAIVNYNQNSKPAVETTVTTTIETTINTTQTEALAPVIATTSTETTITSEEESTTTTTVTPALSLTLSSELDSIVLSLKSDATSRDYDSIASNHPGVMKYLNNNAFAYSDPEDAIIVIASDYNGDGTNELFICGLNGSLEDYRLLEMYSMTSSGAVRVCPISADYELSYHYFTGIGVVSQDDSYIVDVLKLSEDGSALIVDKSYNSFDDLDIHGSSIPGESKTLKEY